MEDTLYFVSGLFSYTQGGVGVTVPLDAAEITVKPDPLLAVDYFFQRDVFSDDPFTPIIEPAEPFSLGLLMRNSGGNGSSNTQRARSAYMLLPCFLTFLWPTSLLGAAQERE